MIELEHVEIVPMRNGYCFVDKRSGTALTRKEHDFIMEGIRPNLWALGQRDIEAVVKANPVTEWEVFMDCEDFSMKNPKDYEFGCVYFGCSDAKPNLYKVGRTTNIVNRSKGHKSKLRAPFEVVAIGKTDYHVEHEAAILKYLTKEGLHHDGEWFVLYAISDIMGIVSGMSYI